VRRAGLAASGAAGAAVLASVVGIAAGGEGAGPARAAAGGDTSTARVERRDLVERETVAGTLGYPDAGLLRAGVPGTLTRMRPEGTVVRRGGWTHEVDGRRTGWVLYGARPAWRALSPWMRDGADVRQLEANLRALGHDTERKLDVDGSWDAATTAAVVRFQAARGLEEDGTLDPGEIVFRPGAVRLGEAKADVGDEIRPGTPLAGLTGSRREVTVPLGADRQDVAREGATVGVTLPDARTARGRVTEVGKVAREGDDGSATITVRVRLLGGEARRSGYDRAPVDVGFERERAKAALTVPVTALVARPGGGYAVEVAARGRRRMVPVRTGLTADGLVAVDGRLREGESVVVPA